MEKSDRIIFRFNNSILKKAEQRFSAEASRDKSGNPFSAFEQKDCSG